MLNSVLEAKSQLVPASEPAHHGAGRRHAPADASEADFQRHLHRQHEAEERAALREDARMRAREAGEQHHAARDRRESAETRETPRRNSDARESQESASNGDTPAAPGNGEPSRDELSSRPAAGNEDQTAADRNAESPPQETVEKQEPTSQALVTELKATAEAPVLETIAPAKPAGQPGGLTEAADAGASRVAVRPADSTSPQQGVLQQALQALKAAASGKQPPHQGQEGARQAATQAGSRPPAQARQNADATGTGTRTPADLAGASARSLMPQVLAEARALAAAGQGNSAINAKEAAGGKAGSGASTTEAALARLKGSISQPLTAGFAEALDAAGNFSADETGSEGQSLQNLLNTASRKQAGQAAGGKAGDISLAALKGKSEAGSEAARPQAEIAAGLKGLGQQQPGNGAAPELLGAHKTAETQGLTSTGAKPAQASLAQQSSPAANLQSVGVYMARKAAEGQTRFNIRMDPPELGRVEVRLEFGDDGRMRAHMVVEKAETLDLLQRDQRQLERGLQQGGGKGFDGELSFSLKDQGQSGSGERQGNGRAPQQGEAGPGDSAAANDTPAPENDWRQVRIGGVDMSV